MPEPDDNDGIVPGGTNPGGESGDGNAPGGGAPQTVKIGEAEMPVDQVTELVEAGKNFKAFKEKYPDIDLEGLVPAFTQQSQLLKDPDKLIEHLRQQFPDKFGAGSPTSGGQNPEEAAQIASWLQQQGFLRQEQAQQMVRDAIQQDREDQKYEGILGKLETELDGKDGRPKFDRRTVLLHGQKKGIYDPQAAYNDLHGPALQEWYASQKLGKKPKGVTTEKGGAGMQLPKDEKVKFGTPAMGAAMDRVLDSMEDNNQ